MNLFTLSDQMFDVTCYQWRIIGFNSYKFVRNIFVCCIKFNFQNVLYILVDVVISLDLL